MRASRDSAVQGSTLTTPEGRYWYKLKSAARIIYCDLELIQEVIADDPIKLRTNGRAQHIQKLAEANGVIANNSASYRQGAHFPRENPDLASARCHGTIIDRFDGQLPAKLHR